jgi:nicotinate-nucleotide pyrophosphorylase
MGLYDMMMIKDNHIAAAGGIRCELGALYLTISAALCSTLTIYQQQRCMWFHRVACHMTMVQDNSIAATGGIRCSYR